MPCNDITRVLADHVVGTLDVSIANEVHDHIGQCATCAREAQRLRTLFAALPSERPPLSPELSAILLAGINARIDAQQQEKRTIRRVYALRWQLFHWFPQRGVRLGLTVAVVAAGMIFGFRTPDLFSPDHSLRRELQRAVAVLDQPQLDELEQTMLLDAQPTVLDLDHLVISLDSTVLEGTFSREVFAGLSASEVLAAGTEYLDQHDMLSSFDEQTVTYQDAQWTNEL